MARKPERPRAPTENRPGGPSEEEARLFRAAMADAKQLPGGGGEIAPDTAGRTAPAGATAHDGPPPPPRRTPKPSARLPHLDAGVAAGLDGRSMDRLRRGRIRPEARLDLHGMTRKEAHAALTPFMARAESGGLRCVILITGKGRVSEGGGVLRNEVPGWLNAPAIRHMILGFAEAQPKDGGAGALYVLLRRVRGSDRGTTGAP